MTDLIYYIHGSSDSTDKDVIYVLDTMPSITECKKFCDGKGINNGNIITVKDGIVLSAFKGSVDEVNNSLLSTYSLHEQKFPLIITHKVKRDVILKDIRVVRKILSTFTRTQYRKTVKEALRGSWHNKISLLKNLDYGSIDLDNVEKSSKKDLLKSFAFQIGQALALHNGVELYTKREIREYFPDLEPYIQRNDTSPDKMVEYIRKYATLLESIPTESKGSIVHFGEPFNDTYDISKELKINK
jgi:hypothetical protein